MLSTRISHRILPQRLTSWVLSLNFLFQSLCVCLSIHFASNSTFLPKFFIFSECLHILPPFSTLCLSITTTFEAIITFHPSIKHSQLWSISTLSPLHSAARVLKCLPSVSVSTYLTADEAILDSKVDDYYNRFHNAFQHFACVHVCVWGGAGFCKWNTWESIDSHCQWSSLLQFILKGLKML